MIFDRKIAFFALEANDKKDALKQMADSLYAAGLVETSFYNGIVEREEKFPTGLSVVPYGVAIPHTDAVHVKTPQIAFATLKNPVKFHLMGNGGNEIDVSLIFMLALKKAEDQLIMLQKLMEIFQDSSLLTDFATCKDQEELDALLTKVGLE